MSTNLPEMIRELVDCDPDGADVSDVVQMMEVLGEKVSANLVKHVLRNLRREANLLQGPPDALFDNPQFVPESVRNSIPTSNESSTWIAYGDALDDAAFDIAEALIQKLTNKDRFFGGMLVDPSCEAFEELLLRVKLALAVRMEGRDHTNEQIMADWIKHQSEVWGLPFNLQD